MSYMLSTLIELFIDWLAYVVIIAGLLVWAGPLTSQSTTTLE